jgi:hypothetical protein
MLFYFAGIHGSMKEGRLRLSRVPVERDTLLKFCHRRANGIPMGSSVLPSTDAADNSLHGQGTQDSAVDIRCPPCALPVEDGGPHVRKMNNFKRVRILEDFLEEEPLEVSVCLRTPAAALVASYSTLFVGPGVSLL